LDGKPSATVICCGCGVSGSPARATGAAAIQAHNNNGSPRHQALDRAFTSFPSRKVRGPMVATRAGPCKAFIGSGLESAIAPGLPVTG
jgi:hypothetical protein